MVLCQFRKISKTPNDTPTTVLYDDDDAKDIKTNTELIYYDANGFTGPEISFDYLLSFEEKSDVKWLSLYVYSMRQNGSEIV